MIKLENTQTYGWEAAIRGMRNPMNSWAKSDTTHVNINFCDNDDDYELAEMCGRIAPIIGPNDHELMMKLVKGGSVHAKFRRMITVYVDITAPLYWWKEFDTYKVGTVANSCSTMHKIAEKEFTLEDFSCEHLLNERFYVDNHCPDTLFGATQEFGTSSTCILEVLCDVLNRYRELYIKSKNKTYWWQMIQLLPSSYNQKRTIMVNYEVLAGIYPSRKNHKLDEWHTFCDWIKKLPYSEIITGEEVSVFHLDLDLYLRKGGEPDGQREI